jgi:hypothetical protein
MKKSQDSAVVRRHEELLDRHIGGGKSVGRFWSINLFFASSEIRS